MLERMPPARLEDLKTGESIVVSSTKGNQKSYLTAIMLLANADMLIQLASAQSQAGQRQGGMGRHGTGGHGGRTGGFRAAGDAAVAERHKELI
jgi:hypothetical protein